MALTHLPGPRGDLEALGVPSLSRPGARGSETPEVEDRLAPARTGRVWDGPAPHILSCTVASRPPWRCSSALGAVEWGCSPPWPRLGLSLVAAAQGMGASPGVSSEYTSWPVQQRFEGFHQSRALQELSPLLWGAQGESDPRWMWGAIRESWVLTGCGASALWESGRRRRSGQAGRDCRTSGFEKSRAAPPNPDLPLVLKNQPVWKPGPPAFLSPTVPHCRPLMGPGEAPERGPHPHSLSLCGLVPAAHWSVGWGAVCSLTGIPRATPSWS